MPCTKIIKQDKHTYDNSEEMNNILKAVQSNNNIASLFGEARNKIKDSDCLVPDVSKDERDILENVEEIVVLPDIYQSECLLREVKNEDNDSLSQGIKHKEKETYKNNETKPAVFRNTYKTEFSLKNMPVEENESGKNGSNSSQIFKVMSNSLLETIPVAMLEMCNIMENKSLDHSSRIPGNEECSTYCVKCNKIGNLKNHRCTAGYQYKCSVCNKMFKHDKSLKCHMILHTGESVYKCQICGKICAKRSTLLSHLQVHTNEKNYKCNNCSKIFKSNRSLKDHMAVHTGESFKCKFCGKTYFHRTSLLCHLLVHDDEKTHSCTVCGKCFKAKGDLNVHLLIHSKEKKA